MIMAWLCFGLSYMIIIQYHSVYINVPFELLSCAMVLLRFFRSRTMIVSWFLDMCYGNFMVFFEVHWSTMQIPWYVNMAVVQYYGKCQSTMELYVLFGHVRYHSSCTILLKMYDSFI